MEYAANSMNKRLIIRIFACMAVLLWHADAQGAVSQWKTHFSYNDVEQIAVSKTHVYAMANGAMFSIDKQTEQLTTYNSQSGMHGTEIARLAYDEAREQLLIFYADGKLDILRDGRMRYVPDLYNKRMTASKYCNNVTISGNKAYLSMEFGVLLFDLERYEFRDAYYIGAQAAEVQVQDVMLYGDSIYAKTVAGNYCAALADKLVDYHYWHECSTLPAPFNADKGKQYIDSRFNTWRAANEKGVYRRFLTGEETYYLPEGPQVNIPYRMTADRGRLFVVPGGRWASQYSRPGHVMILKNGKWTNITQAAIQAQTGKPALDFMNVAVDPKDGAHFYVTSYGTGLYEFRGEELLHHYTPSNSILEAAAKDAPDYYTRTNSGAFDAEGRLWTVVAGTVDTALVAFLPDNQGQRGMNLYRDGHVRVNFVTAGDMLTDHYRPHVKWVLSNRADPAIVYTDDGGTPFEPKDDKTVIRSLLYDQDNQPVVPELYYSLSQSSNGDVWVGTSAGPVIIDHSTDFTNTDVCRRLRIGMSDGTYMLESEQVNAVAFDGVGNVWIGTQTAGVYVIDKEETHILAHYTSDDTPMPANTILSLAYDSEHDVMYVGTGGGLVSYSISSQGAGLEDTSEENRTYGSMLQWRAHLAYGTMEQVVAMGQKVYAMSNGALFSVDKQSEEIEYYNRLTGLNGSVIDHIYYNPSLRSMLITYQDGQLDVMGNDGSIRNIPDLYLKSISGSKQVNDALMVGNKAYLAMDFGIMVLDMKRLEVQDTYYIGNDASEISVQYVATVGDSIYAVADYMLYSAGWQDNLADFAQWHKRLIPNTKKVQGMKAFGGSVCVLRDDTILSSLQNGAWKDTYCIPLRGLCQTGGRLYGLPRNKYGIMEVREDYHLQMAIEYGYVYGMAADGDCYWLGTETHGVVRIENGNVQEFHPDGPISNMSYRLRSFGDRLYVLPGGRWAAQENRYGMVMYYENGIWTNITNGELAGMANHAIYDVMNVAQDPNNKDHYFLTTYGTGLWEMQGKEVKKLYLASNSALEAVISAAPDLYTRTDGAVYDEQGNLWILNAGVEHSVHVVSPDGKWHSFGLYPNGKLMTLTTPGEIMIDNRNPQWKWIPVCRAGAGLILLQDNGTPTDPSDDVVTFRGEWYDQQGKQILPSEVRALAQDRDGVVWVGTKDGVFHIPSSVDFASSNACERIVIPRNDGTQLGDYLLDNEQINCIAVDGANRKWIGTASSGVFLLDIQRPIETAGWDVETVAHFTTANSLLPSDNILSIAIQESTGEVFIGTSAGLVSYMSDAVEPEDNFNGLYAYPNPVRPNYYGYITIKGLMADTEVRITDAQGNLVKVIQGNGGEAIWDATNTAGKRVASGVYTAVCNTQDGQGHGTAKILIMN